MWVVLGVENSLIVTTLSVKESEAVRKVVEMGGGGQRREVNVVCGCLKCCLSCCAGR